MKIKDTVHFNWYKHLFLVALLAVCIGTSVYVTDGILQKYLEIWIRWPHL